MVVQPMQQSEMMDEFDKFHFCLACDFSLIHRILLRLSNVCHHIIVFHDHGQACQSQNK